MILPDRCVPMQEFSARVSPSPSEVMAVFHAYGDESYREAGVNDLPGVYGFFAFVATLDVWKRFEQHWASVLLDHGVPYLHMNEFTQSRGPFAKWARPEQKAMRDAFIADCAKAVREAGPMRGMGGMVFTKDLERFNRDFDQSVVPYAFALSAVLLNLCIGLTAEGVVDEMTVVCDGVDRPNKRIYEALGYLAHDPRFRPHRNRVKVVPLSSEESFKTVLPIQLADFGVWEARRAYDYVAGWLRDRPGDSLDDPVAYTGWRFDYERRLAQARGRPVPSRHEWPDRRTSSRLLVEATADTNVFFWDYEALVQTSKWRKHRWTY